MSHVFDVDLTPESPELLETARVQLRETPEIREAGFNGLRELLKQNPDLNFRDDDDFLIIPLRCCHWYPESAIKLVSLLSVVLSRVKLVDCEEVFVKLELELCFRSQMIKKRLWLHKFSLSPKKRINQID